MPPDLRALPAQANRKPVHPAIDEKKINDLVRHFYGRVRQDEQLGPIFAKAIGDDWEPHLLRIVDFWSSVLLKTGRYEGQPMRKHAALTDVRPAHFARWLEMFGESARELFEPDVAQVFIDRANLIARSLQLGMFGVDGVSGASGNAKTGLQG
ncbi:MAG: group III truncated hemoglobin [Alphaproteobacteria bacterium]